MESIAKEQMKFSSRIVGIMVFLSVMVLLVSIKYLNSSISIMLNYHLHN